MLPTMHNASLGFQHQDESGAHQLQPGGRKEGFEVSSSMCRRALCLCLSPPVPANLPRPVVVSQ